MIFASWLAIRYWLLLTFSTSTKLIRLLDIRIVSVAGIIVIFLLTWCIGRPVASYVGPTQINAVKLLFQIVGLSVVLLIIFPITGASLVSTFVGVGFFSIVIGLAAQSVLGLHCSEKRGNA
jgi:small-conductance mechanosensitive channel